MRHIIVPHPAGNQGYIVSFPETGSEPPVQYHQQFIFDLGEEIGRLTKQRNKLVELIRCVETNLSKGMSKSIQKLQAREIREELAAVEGEE